MACLLATAAALLVLTAGCKPPAVAESRAAPFVVITLGALPTHLVGALDGEVGWTPNLDTFAAEAWTTRAVAPSSSPIPSMASLLTGVDGWTHQLVSHRVKALRADVATLPAALDEGWSRRAYFPLYHRFQEYGLLDAFDTVEELPPVEEMAGLLEGAGDRSLIWIHLPDPSFPWIDRRSAVPRLEPRKGTFDRLERRWLMPYADPEIDMPERLLSEAQELLRHQVAWADQRLGLWLEALRRNPQWPRLWLVVTALHGLEMGEHGQILFAQNLERASLEVPLFVKPGPHSVRRLEGQTFTSTSRIAATLIEAAGRRPSPAMAPSLFAPPQSALSSLYDHGGVNRLSLVRRSGRGAIQLLWSRRYSGEEPEMWAAEAVEAGLGSQEVEEPPRLVLERIRRAFRDVAPLRGMTGSSPEVRLVRWHEGRGVEVLRDAASEGRMLRELHRRWRLFQAVERTPREEVRYWSEER